MSYHHLTTFERGRIQELLSLGYSHRRIAAKIHRHRSCVDREILRNAQASAYVGESAQDAYHARRKRCRPNGKWNAATIPEQIANTITLGKISFKTIYNWVYQGKLAHVQMTVLRQKGKRQKPAETRGKFSVGISIHQRPKEIKSRETFVHWELDSMVSSRGESKGCFATFVERKSRWYIALKTADRTAESMKNAITQLYNTLPKDAFKTGTTHRGKEFACFQAVNDELGLPLYFADPYSSWQRGSNENSNGLLREFYPKKTNLALIDQKELTQNLFLINSRAKKCLGWKSPIQVFLHEVAHLT
ncbi:MAG: IS30 family transposase [Clostridiales bacterium]